MYLAREHQCIHSGRHLDTIKDLIKQVINDLNLILVQSLKQRLIADNCRAFVPSPKARFCVVFGSQQRSVRGSASGALPGRNASGRAWPPQGCLSSTPPPGTAPGPLHLLQLHGQPWKGPSPVSMASAQPGRRATAAQAEISSARQKSDSSSGKKATAILAEISSARQKSNSSSGRRPIAAQAESNSSQGRMQTREKQSKLPSNPLLVAATVLCCGKQQRLVIGNKWQEQQ